VIVGAAYAFVRKAIGCPGGYVRIDAVDADDVDVELFDGEYVVSWQGSGRTALRFGRSRVQVARLASGST
jgi:hypothetical protein